MFRRYECVFEANLVIIVQILESEQTFGYGVRRQELGIPREPIHLVHFLTNRVLRRPQQLNAVHDLLINVSLSEGPELVHLFDKDVELFCKHR